VPPLVDAFNSPSLDHLVPGPVRTLAAAARPLLISSSYGLFRTMTTTRPEIQVEGSTDGVTWREYAFRFKPGDPRRAPRFFAPHMPRLDWQMWFAALRAEPLARDPRAASAWLQRGDGWLGRLVVGLLRGEPEVLALLEPSPFGSSPPHAVRLVLWEYRFSDGGRAWWTRERVGVLAGPWRLPASATAAPAGAPGG
jgi:lipase maturation factor 1